MFLDIDSHPQQQEQSSKSHKYRSHGSYQELFEQLPGEFAGGDLMKYFVNYKFADKFSNFSPRKQRTKL